MKRKLIRQGGGGYTLYLPKSWVEERGLKAGEEINLNEVNDKIVISSNSYQKLEMQIKLENDSTHYIYVKLSHAYRMGFDKMIIYFNNETALAKIKKIVKDNLLGFEITDHNQNKCVVENITEPTDEKFAVLLRRIYLQIKETHSLILEDFSHSKKDKEAEIKDLRTSLDKHIFFCRRVISKKMNIEENSVLHWELLTFLMHIHHSYYYMYENYNREKLNPKTLNLFRKLESYFNKYYRAYFEKKENFLDEIASEKKILFEEVFAELNNTKNKDKVILSYLKEIVRLIQIGGSPVRAMLQ